jgi:cell division protein FtsB
LGAGGNIAEFKDGSKEVNKMARLNTSGFHLAILVLIVLAAYMVWGSNGFMVLLSLKDEEARVLKKNQEIMLENQRIEEIIARLKHDGAYIAHIAKHEFGLAGEEELIFRFEPNGPASRDPGPMGSNN